MQPLHDGFSNLISRCNLLVVIHRQSSQISRHVALNINGSRRARLIVRHAVKQRLGMLALSDGSFKFRVIHHIFICWTDKVVVLVFLQQFIIQSRIWIFIKIDIVQVLNVCSAY